MFHFSLKFSFGQYFYFALLIAAQYFYFPLSHHNIDCEIAGFAQGDKLSICRKETIGGSAVINKNKITWINGGWTLLE